MIARNSSFTYKGQAVDVKQVGRELGVRYVLEGSAQSGNRVRVTAQLIDAKPAPMFGRSTTTVTSATSSRCRTRLPRLCGAIAPAIAYAEQHRVFRKPPDRLDAWDAYQRGLWHF